MLSDISAYSIPASTGVRYASQQDANLPVDSGGAITGSGEDVVDLSPRARALRTQMVEEQREFADRIRIEARQISQSQGLESGHYDFSKLTHRQLEIVTNDIMLNEGDPNPDATFAMRLALSADGTGFGRDDCTVDYVKILQNMRDERNYRHDATTASYFQEALDFIASQNTAAKAGR